MDNGAQMKWKWALVALLLAIFTVFVVVRRSGNLSFPILVTIVRNSSPLWLFAACLCMVAFIVFEALALLALLKPAGYRPGFKKGILYSTSDIYFSSITPSATGGQPASAYFMVKSAIPLSVITVTLLINLVLYTISILLMGGFCFIIRPEVFFHFSPLAKVLIVIGGALLVVLVVLFLVLLYKPQPAQKIGQSCISFLMRHRVLKKDRNLPARLNSFVERFAGCRRVIANSPRALTKGLLFNFLQRLGQIMVTVCLYKAMAVDSANAVDVWAVQSYVCIGASSIPIPGAMGVSDYILINGLKGLLDTKTAFELGLLSRGLSFYICIAISFVITMIGFYRTKKEETC